MKSYLPFALLLLCAHGASQSLPSSSRASWAYAALGSGLGTTHIAVSTAGAAPEIYLGSYSPFWVALVYDPTTSTYQQSFVSPSYGTSGNPTSIVRIAVADVVGDSNEEIVVGLGSGDVYVYDRATKALLGTWNVPGSWITSLGTYDLDGDGKSEILILDGALHVYTGNGTELWSVPGVTGGDVVAGQFDTDASLEIATGDGHVIDVATRAVQWSSGSTWVGLACADIDHDGMDELIAATPWTGITAIDVDTQSVKWTIPPGVGGTQSMCLADLDGNGTQELLVGDAQWGEVHVYDMATQVELGHINNPEHGVTALAAADVDQDGTTEILWCAGATSTGADHLYVASSATYAVEWQSPDLEGPFVGPLWGDLDGDGLPELVAISTYSESAYSSGRILVFDGQTHALRAISSPIMNNFAWTGIHDATLYDFDHDGHMEIVVAADQLYDGRIEVWGFTPPGTFTLRWTNATRPSGSPFYSVAVGDVDGDGNLEIVGGVGAAHSGSPGIFVYVYSYATTQEVWHSGQMGNTGAPIDRVLVRNTDADPNLEVVALVRGGGIHVLDGVTRLEEASLSGTFTTCDVVQLGGAASARLIAAGDSNGGVTFFRFLGGAYTQVAGAPMSTAAIDGLTMPFQRLMFLGSQGSLRVHRSLNQPPLWQSEPYGSLIGRKCIYRPNGTSRIYACSSYAVLGF